MACVNIDLQVPKAERWININAKSSSDTSYQYCCSSDRGRSAHASSSGISIYTCYLSIRFIFVLVYFYPSLFLIIALSRNVILGIYSYTLSGLIISLMINFFIEKKLNDKTFTFFTWVSFYLFKMSISFYRICVFNIQSVALFTH